MPELWIRDDSGFGNGGIHALGGGVEFRRRRQAIHMSQSAFADYFGVGPASIKRWELGQVQDRAMDHLIRLKTDAGEAASNYRAVRALTGPRVKVPTERVTRA
jgi:transcriptional regulator with XRE-family HTH domain